MKFTAVIEKEKLGYVALCPELDVASQGYTVEEAHTNLKEAVELDERLHSQVFVTSLDVAFG
jgi:predicted RNase H-like HicB family nuclease